MNDLPEPRAARLRRPSWRDTRLLVGLVIVLASVALGARVVAALDDSVPVLAAARTLPAGTVLATQDLRVVRVRLAEAAPAYVSAAGPPAAGSVLLRSVSQGELLPAAAVGPPQSLTLRPVAVPVTAPLPEGLRVGAAVDVWSSARDTTAGAASGAFRPPARIAAGAQIAAVTAEAGQLGVTRNASVQVLLPEKELTLVLDALANGAKVALVPGPPVPARSAG